MEEQAVLSCPSLSHWSWQWQAHLGNLLLLLPLLCSQAHPRPSLLRFLMGLVWTLWDMECSSCAPAVLHPTPRGTWTVLTTRGRCFPSLTHLCPWMLLFPGEATLQTSFPEVTLVSVNQHSQWYPTKLLSLNKTKILQNKICSKLHFERELLPAPSS